jgi:hypothetical protein
MSTALRSCLLVLVAAGLGSAEVSCGERCLPDQAHVLDTRDGFYLVYRVTGFQDKVEFFEVYKGKPEFNSCGMPQSTALATEFYERKMGLLRKVEWRGDQLRVVYTHDASLSIAPLNARFSP